MPPKGSTIGNSARNVAAAEFGSVRRKLSESMCCIHSYRYPSSVLRRAFQRSRERRQLLAGALAVALVKSLIHSRESPPPRSPCIRRAHKSQWRNQGRCGSPCGSQQRPLRPAQSLVQARCILRRTLLLDQDLRTRSLEMASGGVHRIQNRAHGCRTCPPPACAAASRYAAISFPYSS